MLCCNSSIDIDLREELKQKVTDLNIPLHFVPQLTLVEHFYSIDKVFARDYWGIPFETGQVLSKQDFLARYQAGGFATPLDNKLYGREEELETLSELLAIHKMLLVSGPPGIGKSRLVMQAIDNFVATNLGYLAYYIMSKPESITEDLLSFLTPENAYILLIDDANRQLDNILSILDRVVSSGLKVKIILTVREYGRADVENALHPTPFVLFPIRVLPDQIVEQILFEEPFAIRRVDIRTRIVEISKGNARLAIMAADAVKRNPDIAILKNVTLIYDEYFKSIIKDAKVLNDEKALKVLGLLSFFQTIDRDDPQEIAVLNDFGISVDDFIQYIHILEPLELVDVAFKSVVKISDQVLGTYFFFDVFLRKRLLDPEHLLYNYFQKFNYQIRDTFLPAMSTFGVENAVGDNAALLVNIYDRIKGNNDDCYAFFDVFGSYLPEKVFGFVYRVIAAMPDSDDEFEFINAYKNRQSNEHDRTLLLLGKFYQGSVKEYLTAMGLAISYVHKQKPLLDMLVGQLKAPLYASHEDVSNNFEKQKAAYKFLKDHLNDSPGYKYLFYYVLQHAFLVESKTVFLPEFAALREAFLEDINVNFPRDRSITYDLLMDYLQPHGRGTYEYLHVDQPQFRALINAHIVSGKFEDAYFVLAYLDLLTDRHIAIMPELKALRRKFLTTAQRIWRTLALERGRNGRKFDHFIDFQAEHDAKIQRIATGFKVNDLNAFRKLFKSISITP